MRYLILILFVSKVLSLNAQDFVHSFSTSFVSWYGTNTREFRSQFSKQYTNNFNLPNFNYELTYKNKYVLGLSYYFSHIKNENLDRPVQVGVLENFEINTYIINFGILKSLSSHINIKPTIGMGLFVEQLSSFVIGYPRIWEPEICDIRRGIQLNLAFEADYVFDCGAFFGLKFNYFPMIKSLPNDCKFKVYERIQILMGQLNVGYLF